MEDASYKDIIMSSVKQKILTKAKESLKKVKDLYKVSIPWNENKEILPKNNVGKKMIRIFGKKTGKEFRISFGYKTLGINSEVRKNEFSFDVYIDEEAVMTKRKLLSIVARIFGLLL